MLNRYSLVLYLARCLGDGPGIAGGNQDGGAETFRKQQSCSHFGATFCANVELSNRFKLPSALVQCRSSFLPFSLPPYSDSPSNRTYREVKTQRIKRCLVLFPGGFKFSHWSSITSVYQSRMVKRSNLHDQYTEIEIWRVLNKAQEH